MFDVHFFVKRYGMMKSFHYSSSIGSSTHRFSLLLEGFCTIMSTNHVPEEMIKRYYRVDRREIAFLRFVFEAYEGLAIIETLDPESGVIVFYIAPGCESDVDMILRDLQGDIMMEAVQV